MVLLLLLLRRKRLSVWIAGLIRYDQCSHTCICWRQLLLLLRCTKGITEWSGELLLLRWCLMLRRLLFRAKSSGSGRRCTIRITVSRSATKGIVCSRHRSWRR